MKCIKEKCRYYRENDFHNSYFYCETLSYSLSFRKDEQVECIIPPALEKNNFEVDKIKKYYEEVIRKNQL